MQDWKKEIPRPIYEAHPEYNELYLRAWELAHDHIKEIEGMPQTPYMDEAFCDTQIWIWDTCFMTLFCKYAPHIFPGVESLNNFYTVLHGHKKLPMIIPTEREPAWTKKPIGQPCEIDVHLADNPPLFAWAEYENARMKGDLQHIKTLLYEKQYLQKHYHWVEQLKEQIHPAGVHARTYLIAEENGYHWEGGRSGMDNTPRGRLGYHEEKQRPQNPDMLWLDALCQQALSALCIAKLFGLAEDSANQKEWMKEYEKKKALLNTYYWDSEDEFYYDIDCNTHAFYKIMTIASYWGMTAEAATPAQAAAMAKRLEQQEYFGGNLPFPSLSRSDGDYEPEGKYWRGGIWLPTAYATLQGLKNYGLFDLAHTTAQNLLEHMYRTYKEVEPHTIWECYSPEGCLPATNEHGEKWVRKDFCGWSALGPISAYIEFVLGFHTADAFTQTVEWAMPAVQGAIGIQNLRFGEITTDILAKDGLCRVTASHPYTLKINGTAYPIHAGENTFNI